MPKFNNIISLNLKLLKMKKVITTVLITVFFGCFLGKAQVILQASTPPAAAPIATTPAGISQLEVRNKLITQNAFAGTGVIPTNEQTGEFGTSARWNSMGSLNAGSQLLNGFRTQTNGKGLTLGYSVIGTTVSHPTIQWIGNSGASVSPGNLEFKFALSPGSPGSPATDFPIFTMAPTFKNGLGVVIPSFNYAETDAFIGQLQSGNFGDFGGGDTWSATGQVAIPGVLTAYGSRHQYKGVSAILGNIEDGSQKIKTVLDFGSFLPAISTSQTGIFQFRTFTDPTNSASIKNVWQSGNNYGNVLFSRQDYGSVTSSNFYVSVLDGVASAPSTTATSFIQKAGIYATSDGKDQNNGGAQLASYAAIAGDISGVTLSPNTSQKYTILGIANSNYTGGTSSGRWAGFFIGDVNCTGTYFNFSDQKFKKDVEAEENIMPRLMQLQPKNYLFDIEKYKNMAFSNRLQHGLISQEVEKVFPELVVDAFAPNTSNDKNKMVNLYLTKA